MDDTTLLQEYARTGAESAFAELVQRHVGLVYAAARRQVRDPQHAEDVTQAVFIVLARKAGQVARHPGLSGWLLQTTRYAANAHIRTAVRRARREQEAAMQPEPNDSSPATWAQLEPHLDAAMASLGTTDRAVLALRYFENKTAAEIGQTLQLNEEAAKKRSARALEKLRKFFRKQGVVLSTQAIAASVATNSVHAAPSGLAAKISVVAAAKGAAASASTATLIKGALKIMAWTKAKTAIIAGACVLLTAGTTTAIILNYHPPVRGIPPDWSVLSGHADQWNWANDTIASHSTTGESILASTKKYRNVTISAILGSTNRGAELVLRMQDARNGYHVIYTPDDTPWAADNGSLVKLVKSVDGQETDLAIFKRRKLAHQAKVTVHASGPWIDVRLNDVEIIKARDAAFAAGYVGLRVFGDPVKPSDSTFSQLTFY